MNVQSTNRAFHVQYLAIYSRAMNRGAATMRGSTTSLLHEYMDSQEWRAHLLMRLNPFPVCGLSQQSGTSSLRWSGTMWHERCLQLADSAEAQHVLLRAI
jgi:hypothetical protein